jgi:hypothetical protein
MINCLWPKPPETDRDLQPDHDPAMPEEYRRNGIAMIDQDHQNEAVGVVNEDDDYE